MTGKPQTREQPDAAIPREVSFSSRDLPPTDPTEPTQLARIPITKIREYDRNPRTEANQKYAEIKQAIRNKHGLDQQLTITRRPGEEHLPYLLYAGGNTRLHILKELYEETQDEAFFYANCLFRPYTSEFDLMVAHAGENENRGDLLWVDKARYVKQLRDQLETDAGRTFSQQELSNAITEHGWSISQETISRLEYTCDVLLPAIPHALSAGLGEPRMRKIRQLENTIKKYLRFRNQAKEELDVLQQWFVECLARHDSEDWDLAPVTRDIVDRLAQVCDESPSRVRIELEAFMRGSQPTSRAHESIPLPASTSNGLHHRTTVAPDHVAPLDGFKNSRETEFQEQGHGGSPTIPESPDPTVADKSVIPHVPESEIGDDADQTTSRVETESVDIEGKSRLNAKDLRARMWTLATRLAQRNHMGECIHHVNRAGGFVIDLPDSPLYVDANQTDQEEYKRVALWWFLAGVADQFLNQYIDRIIPVLPGNAHLKPLLHLMNSDSDDDRRSASDAITTYVSKPPTLDVVVRHLVGNADDVEFEVLISLLDARRQFQALCEQEGKSDLWEV